MSHDVSEPAPHVADAIARAERRRGMLEDLSGVALALAKDIAQRSIDSPYHPELRHDPGRSFASASRAVRLTLAFETRIDEQIIALRNGSAHAFHQTVLPSAPLAIGPRPDCGAEETNDREIDDGEDAERLRDCARECLTEREDFDELLVGDFDTSIAAIRAELGLNTSSLPRSGEGGLAASGREPGGGKAPRLESWECRKGQFQTSRHRPTPPRAAARESTLPASGEGGTKHPSASLLRSGGKASRPPPPPEPHPPPRG